MRWLRIRGRENGDPAGPAGDELPGMSAQEKEEAFLKRIRELV